MPKILNIITGYPLKNAASYIASPLIVDWIFNKEDNQGWDERIRLIFIRGTIKIEKCQFWTTGESELYPTLEIEFSAGGEPYTLIAEEFPRRIPANRENPVEIIFIKRVFSSDGILEIKNISN